MMFELISVHLASAPLPIQPQRIQFEEHAPSSVDIGTHFKAHIAYKESIFEYVKAVVQASGENWDESYIMPILLTHFLTHQYLMR